VSDEKTEQGFFDLLVAAGFLTKCDKTYVLSDPLSSKKLEFYWVVPPSLLTNSANGDQRRGPHGATTMMIRKKLLVDCWAEHVEEYALEIPKDDPTLRRKGQQHTASNEEPPV
jgi:hypothetical protein